jgi:hypothetical protein
MSIKATCKYLFPGKFSKLISKINDAFDETNKRDKKIKYLEIKKEFEGLKKSKRNNGCNNSNEKKIDTIALLIVVLEYDVELNESNMVKIYHELGEVEKEVDKLNISINSVDKGEKLLRKQIKQLYERIKFSSNVSELIKNVNYKSKIENIEEEKRKTRLNNMRKRLAALRGGTRKNRK